jgi:hypothetical protein
MFTKKMFTIFAIALFSFICAASEINAQETKTIKVDAKMKSVDTGDKLEPGDIVEVTDVKGTPQFNESKGFDYQGNQSNPVTPTYEYNKAGTYSLVAFVGNKNNHYQVRKSIFATAPVSGNLFFAYNDESNRYSDNKGAFDVTYKIIKKAKICTVDAGSELDFSWVNKTGAPITVSWINYKCAEEAPQTVQPNASYRGTTYIGHIFRIRDAKSKEEIGLINVEATSKSVDIFPKKK